MIVCPSILITLHPLMSPSPFVPLTVTPKKIPTQNSPKSSITSTSIYLSISSITYALYFMFSFNIPSGLSFARGAFWGVKERIIPLSVNSGKGLWGSPLLMSDGSIIILESIWTFFIFGIKNFSASIGLADQQYKYILYTKFTNLNNIISDNHKREICLWQEFKQISFLNKNIPYKTS